MTVSVESFRATFRAFNDPGKFPDDAVTYYIQLATNFLAGSALSAGNRFDPLSLDRAVSLYMAHQLTLDARDVDAVVAGAVPGELEGVATAKAVDKVSISMDSKAVTFDDEPFWNQTRFGVQLIDLVRMFGAGGIQLGVPSATDSNFRW